MAVTTIYNTPITGQVGGFAAVTMNTPGSDGNYRVGLYMWAPTFGQANKDIIVNVTWIDPSGSQNVLSIGLFTANSATQTRGDATFRAIGGQPIVLSTGLDQNDVTDSYNLYPNLEQL